MKKISLVEGFLMIVLCLTADIVEALTTFIGFGIGEVIDIFVNLAIWPVIQLWLTIKGVKSNWFLAGSLIEFLPFLNAFPTRTITMIITIILDRRPEKAGQRA